MTNCIPQKLLYVACFALSATAAACMSVALASLLAADPKGPDAHGQAVALVACAGLAGTCLTLAAGAGVDED
jgi:hypothetical protein